MARVIVVTSDSPEPGLVREAADVLMHGGLVAFPTETVYGLGADAFDARAIARLYEAKGRPAFDPLIVHVLGIADLPSVAGRVPDTAERLADRFWPGPLSLVLPRGERLPEAVTAGLDTVAVRAPAHPVARALIASSGTAVAAPSANRFGRTSPTTAAHVLAELGPVIDVVLDGGPAWIGVESTVVDCRRSPPVVLRPGGVSLEALAAVAPGIRLCASAARLADAMSTGVILGTGLQGRDTGSDAGSDAPVDSEGPRSPGQLPRHYAPAARLVVVAGDAAAALGALAVAARRLQRAGAGRVGILATSEDVTALGDGATGAVVVALGARDDGESAARSLYAALHDLDEAGVTVILARTLLPAGLGTAVNDRLGRAAEGRVVVVEADRAETAARRIVALASDSVHRP